MFVLMDIVELVKRGTTHRPTLAVRFKQIRDGTSSAYCTERDYGELDILLSFAAGMTLLCDVQVLFFLYTICS